MKEPKTPLKDKTHPSPVVDATRDISERNKLILCVQAGGRCEFNGCNRPLFEHHLTHRRFNFSQMAHIVAFSVRGPRGRAAERPEDINELDNLMLLCHACHKQIDDFPDEFTRETLEGYKKAHEERIHRLTSMAPDRQTSAVTLRSKIAGQTVRISPADISNAVAPRYPATRSGSDIDLTSIDDVGEEFYLVAAKKIRRDLERIQETVMKDEKTDHISLFALAPMPLLILAGSLLSSKLPVDLFQRHRDTEDWTWKKDGEPAQYKFHLLKEGSDLKRVALLLSLSGTVHVDSLPADVAAGAHVYEIALDGASPNTAFLRQREDLDGFKDTYQRALREIGTTHGKLEHLHLFPAVPAPIAVTCGRELMPKIDPVIAIYDDDRRSGSFKKILEVNN